MLNGKTATAAPAENAQHIILHLPEPPERAFRNQAPTDGEFAAITEQLNDLYERCAPENEHVSARQTLSSFVAEAYFAQVPWHQLLHWIVNNIPDKRDFPLWLAIRTAKNLYSLFNF